MLAIPPMAFCHTTAARPASWVVPFQSASSVTGEVGRRKRSSDERPSLRTLIDGLMVGDSFRLLPPINMYGRDPPAMRERHEEDFVGPGARPRPGQHRVKEGTVKTVVASAFVSAKLRERNTDDARGRARQWPATGRAASRAAEEIALDSCSANSRRARFNLV